MTRIYFDTEFEGLFEKAGLISIGLTDSSGNNTFYAEVADTYHPTQCSEFCQRTVLPLLEGGRHEMTLQKLRASLWQWLVERGEGALLICDSRRDITQLEVLFPHGLPKNCHYHVIGPLAKWKRRIHNVGRRLHKKHALRPHHALDDALVNRMIFEGK